MSKEPGAVRRTPSHWSAYEPEIATGFFGFPPLRRYLIATAFGVESAEKHGENRWWAEDIVSDLYLGDRDIASMLSLCCGFGAVEQHMVAYLDSVDTCVAVDIAEGAVEEAARRAAGLGLDKVIRYDVANLNAYEWPDSTYDLVVATGALHHLAELEGVLDGVVRCLKPGGVLFANEHIGASHQDYPKRQLELINATAYLVPPELRCRRPLRNNPLNQRHLRRLADALLGNLDLGSDHAERSPRKQALARILGRVSLPPRRDFGPLVLSPKQRFLVTGPSEGVSSDRIVSSIRARFGEVNVHPYGGAVLAYALDGAFYAGFDAQNPAHARLLHALCSLEAFLVRSGELPDEHAIIVAVKGGVERDGT